MSEAASEDRNGGRRARVERVTKETSVSVELTLADGRPPSPASITTPVPFLSHMIDALARHGALGLVEFSAAQGCDSAVQGHAFLDVLHAIGRAVEDVDKLRRASARNVQFSEFIPPAILDKGLTQGPHGTLVAGRELRNFTPGRDRALVVLQPVRADLPKVLQEFDLLDGVGAAIDALT